MVFGPSGPSVFHTPRFSLDGLKVAVGTALLAACSTACTGRAGQDGYTGGYTGWVYGRVIPVPAMLLGEVSDTSGAGPGSLQGLEWVGI